jgi:hypothetical protein
MNARQRSNARTRLLPGYVQSCLPMRQAELMGAKASESSSQVEIRSLVQLEHALSKASEDLAHPATDTLGQCVCLEHLLRKTLSIVREWIMLMDLLYLPEQAIDPVLWRLWPLHRTVRESLVLVRGLQGQLAREHVHHDPTDVSGHLRDVMKRIQHHCQALKALFARNESTTLPALPLAAASA